MEVTGGRGATVLKAPADRASISATPTRPLCGSAWHLSGSRRRGYVCARDGRRKHPMCRPPYQLSLHAQ